MVLGPTGRNVGAGQTGGWGYFLEDEEGYSLNGRINGDVPQLLGSSPESGLRGGQMLPS